LYFIIFSSSLKRFQTAGIASYFHMPRLAGADSYSSSRGFSFNDYLL